MSFDKSVDQAWVRFQRALGDFLADMADDGSFIIDVQVGEGVFPEEGCAPYVQFAAYDDGAMLRGEVASNAYLAPTYRLSERQEQCIGDLGWKTPTFGAGEPADSGSPLFFSDQRREFGDLLALMSVRALREVFDVPHPTFLTGGPAG